MNNSQKRKETLLLEVYLTDQTSKSKSMCFYLKETKNSPIIELNKEDITCQFSHPDGDEKRAILGIRSDAKATITSQVSGGDLLFNPDELIALNNTAACRKQCLSQITPILNEWRNSQDERRTELQEKIILDLFNCLSDCLTFPLRPLVSSLANQMLRELGIRIDSEPPKEPELTEPEIPSFPSKL